MPRVRECPRCGEDVWEGLDRIWTHRDGYTDPETGEHYEWLCDDCHREVVRERG